MSDERRTFRLRVTYGKTGRLALLSHLEVTHALERMIRRAGLPFAITGGFSPHMKISFGSALPVGIGGTQEICDVHLKRYLSAEKALQALQKVAPADLMPLACAYVEPSAKAASVAFPLSTYEALLSSEPEEVIWPSEITVMRKKKEKVLLVENFLVGAPRLEGCVLRYDLEAKETGTLRADVFLEHALAETIRQKKGMEDLHVVRLTRVAQA